MKYTWPINFIKSKFIQLKKADGNIIIQSNTFSEEILLESSESSTSNQIALESESESKQTSKDSKSVSSITPISWSIPKVKQPSSYEDSESQENEIESEIVQRTQKQLEETSENYYSESDESHLKGQKGRRK